MPNGVTGQARWRQAHALTPHPAGKQEGGGSLPASNLYLGTGRRPIAWPVLFTVGADKLAISTTNPHFVRSLTTKMRLLTFASAVLAASSFASADPHTAQIYIQPVGGASSPVPLAEITYDITNPDDAASVASYEAPELPESTSLVRIGLYDLRANKWAGSTSVVSAENFAKGYSPHFLLNVDATKAVGPGQEGGDAMALGASLRGVRIDAGQTRDFGPQVKLVLTGWGKQPDLNKPVVLSPEGKKVEKEEKTFFQKFVWLSLPGTGALLMCGHANLSLQVLVDDRYCCVSGGGRRWRRGQVELDDDAMRSCGTQTFLLRPRMGAPAR